MSFYLIGANGRLGQAIAREYADSEIRCLDRSIYAHWAQPDAADLVTRYFDRYLVQGDVIFIASGLLDPKLTREDLFNVNYYLPKNVIEGVSKFGAKVVTFGTVMEDLLQSLNPYVQAKKALGDYVTTVASVERPVIHMQIHTLYGVGQPSPFMFLGQMLTALHHNTPFKMTLGRQLREYHHVEDEAKAIRLLETVAAPGVIQISHGQPLSLRTIAESVFQALGKSALLEVGALPEPTEENYDGIFTPAEVLQHMKFRDTLPAIISYMSNNGAFQV